MNINALLFRLFMPELQKYVECTDEFIYIINIQAQLSGSTIGCRLVVDLCTSTTFGEKVAAVGTKAHLKMKDQLIPF